MSLLAERKQRSETTLFVDTVFFERAAMATIGLIKRGLCVR